MLFLMQFTSRIIRYPPVYHLSSLRSPWEPVAADSSFHFIKFEKVVGQHPTRLVYSKVPSFTRIVGFRFLALVISPGLCLVPDMERIFQVSYACRYKFSIIPIFPKASCGYFWICHDKKRSIPTRTRTCDRLVLIINLWLLMPLNRF